MLASVSVVFQPQDSCYISGSCADFSTIGYQNQQVEFEPGLHDQRANDMSIKQKSSMK